MVELDRSDQQFCSLPGRFKRSFITLLVVLFLFGAFISIIFVANELFLSTFVFDVFICKLLSKIFMYWTKSANITHRIFENLLPIESFVHISLLSFE